VILVGSLAAAVVAHRAAAEHMEILTVDPRDFLERMTN